MRSLQTELIDKGFVKSMKERKQVSKKKKEHFTERELQELMGMHRDTFRRGKGGMSTLNWTITLRYFKY